MVWHEQLPLDSVHMILHQYGHRELHAAGCTLHNAGSTFHGSEMAFKKHDAVVINPERDVQVERESSRPFT